MFTAVIMYIVYVKVNDIWWMLTFTAVFDECQHFEWILKICQHSQLSFGEC